MVGAAGDDRYFGFDPHRAGGKKHRPGGIAVFIETGRTSVGTQAL